MSAVLGAVAAVVVAVVAVIVNRKAIGEFFGENEKYPCPRWYAWMRIVGLLGGGFIFGWQFGLQGCGADLVREDTTSPAEVQPAPQKQETGSISNPPTMWPRPALSARARKVALPGGKNSPGETPAAVAAPEPKSGGSLPVTAAIAGAAAQCLCDERCAPHSSRVSARWCCNRSGGFGCDQRPLSRSQSGAAPTCRRNL